MSRQTTFGIALLSLLGVGLAYLAWHLTYSADHETCHACGRPIHANALTVALVDGSHKSFCCPTCILTQHHQTSEDVQVTRLTDHATGEALEPDEALVVYGSDFNMCLRENMLRPDRSDTAALDFDRCAPSMVAFADRNSAQTFAAQHGGRIVPFPQLASQYAASPQ